MRSNSDILPLSEFANALTLPVGLNANGIPVGLQSMCENGQDEKLVCIASCIERLIGNRAERIGSAPNIPC